MDAIRQLRGPGAVYQRGASFARRQPDGTLDELEQITPYIDAIGNLYCEMLMKNPNQQAAIFAVT